MMAASTCDVIYTRSVEDTNMDSHLVNCKFTHQVEKSQEAVVQPPWLISVLYCGLSVFKEPLHPAKRKNKQQMYMGVLNVIEKGYGTKWP